MTISHLNGGLEIDRGDADLSSNTRDGMIDVDIGEDYGGGAGGSYARYLSFPLSVEEAKALRDYLTEAIERLTHPDSPQGGDADA